MTQGAITWESGLDVVRVRRPIVGLHMAAIAIRGSPFEAASNVTCGAFERRMYSRQRKAREFQVVELCPKPGISRVAGLAGCREVQGFVVRLGGLLVVARVAGKAGGGEARELAHRFSFVAVGTLEQRMGAQQRKAIFMLLELLSLHLPALHRVTLLAIGAKLAAVNIRVAIRATRAHVGKDKIGMALFAVNFFVHASQRVACPVVVKLRNAADGFPARIRMAVLAGNVDGAVRVPAWLFVGLGPSRRLPNGHDGQQHEQERDGLCRSHGTPKLINGWASGEGSKDYVCLRRITTGQEANLGSVCP